jgi:hypothetical protein
MERQILLEHLADAERHVADGTRIVEAHATGSSGSRKPPRCKLVVFVLCSVREIARTTHSPQHTELAALGYLIQRVVDLLRKNIACHTGGRWNILDKIILWTAGIYDSCHRPKLVESVFWEASVQYSPPSEWSVDPTGAWKVSQTTGPWHEPRYGPFLLKPIADNKAQSPART